MNMNRRDVVIVGGGILGLVLAVLLAEQLKRRVTLIVDPGKDNLGADSLRNQAWLHSMLLYLNGPTVATCRRMYWDGRRMLRHFGIPEPVDGGIFAFRDPTRLQAFVAHASSLGLGESHGVRLLSHGEAADALGELYDSAATYYRVPDSLFDEARLMTVARKDAVSWGAEVVESRVILHRNSSVHNQYFLETDRGDRITANCTVLCAGCGLPELLAQLGLQHPLGITRSVLLRSYDSLNIKIPLFFDSSSGLTVGCHGADVRGHRNGCLVFGDWHRRKLNSDEARCRSVSLAEYEALCKRIPTACLPPSAPRGAIAGHKTEASDAAGMASVDPWFCSYEAFPGLIAAVPGKATLAMYTAEKLLPIVQKYRGMPLRSFASSSSLGPAWTKPILMHDVDEYRDLNEVSCLTPAKNRAR